MSNKKKLRLIIEQNVLLTLNIEQDVPLTLNIEIIID